MRKFICLITAFMICGAAGHATANELETLIQCKPGTKLVISKIESQFVELGLKKAKDGFYYPADGKKSTFLGAELLAAVALNQKGEQKLSVYLNHITGQQLAKKFGVTTVDDYATTDEPSFFKKTSPKTTFLVGSRSILDTGLKDIPFSASLTCQVAQ